MQITYIKWFLTKIFLIKLNKTSVFSTVIKLTETVLLIN